MDTVVLKRFFMKMTFVIVSSIFFGSCLQANDPTRSSDTSWYIKKGDKYLAPHKDRNFQMRNDPFKWSYKAGKLTGDGVSDILLHLTRYSPGIVLTTGNTEAFYIQETSLGTGWLIPCSIEIVKSTFDSNLYLIKANIKKATRQGYWDLDATRYFRVDDRGVLVSAENQWNSTGFTIVKAE